MKKNIQKERKLSNEDIILKRCYKDAYAFCEGFFGDTEHITNEYNQLHSDYFKTFQPKERNRRLVIQAARGSSKTTMYCLIDVLHRICYGTEKYILILSATQDLAKDKSAAIFDEIRDNEKLSAFYHLRFDKKLSSKYNFTVHSRFGTCQVKCMSFFSQIRGSKKGATRPTRIILDDATHAEKVVSEKWRLKEKRQYDTDIKNAGTPYTSFIIIGTPTHKKDLISLLSQDPTYEFRKYPAVINWPKDTRILNRWENIYLNPMQSRIENIKSADKFYKQNKKQIEDGVKLLWADREDFHHLMKERISIGRKAFNAEKQLEPYLEGEALFKTIHYYDVVTERGKDYMKMEDGNLIERSLQRFKRYYAFDPALGEEQTTNSNKTFSDSARIWGMYDIETDILYIESVKLDRKPHSEIIKEMYYLHHHIHFERMAVEENLYKQMFYYPIQKYGEEYNQINGTNLTLPIVPITNTIKKEKRIYALEPRISIGQIRFCKHILEDFRTQLEDYPLCDKNDGLDALEILSQISNPDNKVQTISMMDYK